MNDTRLQRFSGSFPDVAAFCAFDHVWAHPSRLQKKDTEALWQVLHLLTVTSHLYCLQCMVDLICLSPMLSWHTYLGALSFLFCRYLKALQDICMN